MSDKLSHLLNSTVSIAIGGMIVIGVFHMCYLDQGSLRVGHTLVCGVKYIDDYLQE